MASRAQLYFVAARCKEFKGCVQACPERAITLESGGIRIDRDRCTLCMECVDACAYGAFRQVGRRLTVGKVLRDIEKDRSFYGDTGGVTISGGEPLFQPEFTLALLRECRSRGLSTVLDTCGYAPPAVVDEAMKHTELVLLDIKHMDPRRHWEGTGVDNSLILKNALVMAEKTRVRISLPLIPGFNDDEGNLAETSAFAAALGIEHVDLNPMHGLGADKYRCLGLGSPYPGFAPVTREGVERAVDLVSSYGLKATVGRMM
jgi:pyruvate formate lyase activating enzyme